MQARGRHLLHRGAASYGRNDAPGLTWIQMQYFHEWRAADRVAVAAEHAVFRATMRLIDGGRGPTESEISESHRLRAVADDLFSAAMEEMTEMSHRLRR